MSPWSESHRLGRNTRERISSTRSPAFDAYGLFLAGLSEAGVGYAMRRWSPPHDHVLLCMNGRGEVWLGGSYVVCEPGEAYLSPAGRPMAFRTCGRDRWEFAWAYYERRPARPKAVAIARPVKRAVDPWAFSTSILGLYRESVGQAQPSVMDRWVELMQTALLRMVGSSPAGFQLAKLWETVDARLAKRWTLPQLADASGMSREALRRACHDEFGRSPIAQVTHLRMLRAASLLVTTPYTIEAVARKVGYARASTFCTAFRRAYALSPGRYRGDPSR